MDATWLTTAFPFMIFSPESICGIQACTAGDSKAPSTDRTISSAPITIRSFPHSMAKPAAKTASPERRSRATMTFRRFALSARIPPKGDSKIVGSMESASIPAKTEAEPVRSSTYMDRANFSP